MRNIQNIENENKVMPSLKDEQKGRGNFGPQESL